ncbi:hypothetical protein YDYSG_50100 [Paenibacillus tyrfis]|uniref:hypothetical protein n=1 Tax=Paenibacillus tyrfis TaxID=1501230 RepID=UPI0024935160|nr:hypothetical protein [Paenibacillus tyrfis]GLI08978.1 hypothetical protein YDYSG_50100 [Paenibacillus tyrfis]
MNVRKLCCASGAKGQPFEEKQRTALAATWMRTRAVFCVDSNNHSFVFFFLASKIATKIVIITEYNKDLAKLGSGKIK